MSLPNPAPEHEAATTVTVKCSCGMRFDINQPDPGSALALAELLWRTHTEAHRG